MIISSYILISTLGSLTDHRQPMIAVRFEGWIGPVGVLAGGLAVIVRCRLLELSEIGWPMEIVRIDRHGSSENIEKCTVRQSDGLHYSDNNKKANVVFSSRSLGSVK